MKTGSESTQGIMRRRRILLAGFVARMENTRLPKCVMFEELQQEDIFELHKHEGGEILVVLYQL